MLSIEQINEFAQKHNLQIVRGEDSQYHVYIQNECFACDISFVDAITKAIKKYQIYLECEKDIIRARNKLRYEN